MSTEDRLAVRKIHIVKIVLNAPFVVNKTLLKLICYTEPVVTLNCHCRF